MSSNISHSVISPTPTVYAHLKLCMNRRISFFNVFPICSGLKTFYGKKARLKNEITKRQHELFVQAEDREEVGENIVILYMYREVISGSREQHTDDSLKIEQNELSLQFF